MLFNELKSSVFILLHEFKTVHFKGNYVEVECTVIYSIYWSILCKENVLLRFNASLLLYWQCIDLFASLGVISQIIFPYNEHIANIVSLSLSTAHHPDQLTQGLTVLSAQSNNETSVISQCATHTDPSLLLFYEFLTLPLL